MGRPKQFNREGVLDRAIPVFWKHGFANTTVQDLEQATAVNKSGLYTEFKDKEDLFLASLQRYAQTRGAEILTAQPLGWGNIERFLRLGFGYARMLCGEFDARASGSADRSEGNY